MTLLDERPGVEHGSLADVEVLFREARRRRRRRWLLGTCLVVAGMLAACFGFGLSPASPRSTRPSTVPHSGPTRNVAPRPIVHVDVLTARSQTTVRVDGTRLVRGSAVPAAPGVGPAVALARKGYVVGLVMGRYASVSLDLQRIMHTWTSSAGRYPAPASDPADLWLSEPHGQPALAQEYDGHGHTVGSPVAIPSGWLVRGQTGPNLVLQAPPAGQTLALWDPNHQRVVAPFGPFDQETDASKVLAWSNGNLLHLATPAGALLRTIAGPVGDWATSLAISPNQGELAVLWSPRPGSPGMATLGAVAEHSALWVVGTRSALVRILPDSSDTAGPIAWSPRGTQLFYGRMDRSGHSVTLATYPLSGERSAVLRLPHVALPASFGAATGALIPWTAR